MLIEDPKTGNVATVTHEGFLRILGVAIPWGAHHNIDHESAYAVGNGAIAMDGTDNTIFHLENNSQTDDLVITGFIGSTDDTAGVKMTAYSGDSYTSGGTACEAHNLNLTSRAVAETNCYYGNDIVTGAEGNGAIFTGYISQGMTIMPMPNFLVLGYRDTVHINVNGTNAKNATLGIQFFYHGGRF
jgi:hypothetical protein